jgi:hypothetical protein
LRRRSAVEPVIGHAKAEHRMGRNYLAGTHGDDANAVLAAAGYNFHRLLNGRLFCCPQSWPLSKPPPLSRGRSNWPESVLHGRLEDVAADDEVNRWHVQRGGVDGIGASLFNDTRDPE